jgi:hypothetical protein
MHGGNSMHKKKQKYNPKFFQQKKVITPNQNVTVNVTIKQTQEDGITGCFKTLFGCVKKAAK